MNLDYLTADMKNFSFSVLDERPVVPRSQETVLRFRLNQAHALMLMCHFEHEGIYHDQYVRARLLLNEYYLEHHLKSLSHIQVLHLENDIDVCKAILAGDMDEAGLFFIPF